MCLEENACSNPQWSACASEVEWFPSPWGEGKGEGDSDEQKSKGVIAKAATLHTRLKGAEESNGFTLIEMLVVMAIIAVLAALLMPVVLRGGDKSKTTLCTSNLKQINLAALMYAEDNRDAIVLPTNATSGVTDFQLYKQYVKTYAGYQGKSSPSENLFACPSDTFYYSAGNGTGQYHNSGLCAQSFTDFTSYAFNGGNRRSTNYPGIAGVRLGSIHEPSKTLLILEAAAMTPFSWHRPQKAPADYRFFNSMNTVSYVDGHVTSSKMYFPTNSHAEAWQQNPPAGYDYKWSAD